MRKGLLAAMAATALVALPPEAVTARPAPTKRLTSRGPERPRRGRPRKFARPSRAITLTLPEDVIAALQAIDGDISRAVVRATGAVVPEAPRTLAEITARGEQRVIIVPHNPLLKERIGVELVPMADGGALISLGAHVTLPEIELRIVDALADPALPASDRQMLESLAEILRQARQADGIVLREQRILVVEKFRAPRASVVA
jgi:hypothetical protein